MKRPVYIHEQIAIEGGARGRLIELVRSRLAPHFERRHGVRLVGAWATVGSTAHWPEVRLHWEMDDWAHFARAQADRYPMEERDIYYAELWNQALEYRLGGHSMLLRAASFSPDLAATRSQGLSGDVIWHEDVRALPGRLPMYHEALASKFVPLAEQRGIRLLGAYEHALAPNRGVNLWLLEDWNHWCRLMEAEPSDAGLRSWNDGLGEWLEDIDGFLVVPPPKGALRT